MKRLLLAILLSSVLPTALRAQQVDSVKLARLDSALFYYTGTIEKLDVDRKGAECDFLISSTSDSLYVQHIALWLFDHYKESKLMGDEAVAIHIYDNWFKTGAVKMRNEFERMDADIFANFNRSTLLGMKAPEIDLLNSRGRAVKIPSDECVSVLFFYDTSCGKCVVESKVLPGVLQKADFPVRFYAVYAGTDKKAWKKYRRDFKVKSKLVDVVHLWDPEIDSDYLRLYGVMSTPRLYVTDTDGTVLGRRLEVENLQEIIYLLNSVYGTKKD